jgi:hypothetical protein
MGASLAYGSAVIGLLRFVGVLNAAVWLGTAIFFTFGAGLAPFSAEMKALLGPNNFPYYSGAIAHVLISQYFHFQLLCGAVAVVHLLAEWVYLGKYPRRLQVGLLTGMCAAVLVGGYWLQPKLKNLHASKYGLNTPPEIREAAARSFRTWHVVSQVVNVLVVGGLAVYLWRAANPSDPTRFVSSVKFMMR